MLMPFTGSIWTATFRGIGILAAANTGRGVAQAPEGHMARTMGGREAPRGGKVAESGPLLAPQGQGPGVELPTGQAERPGHLRSGPRRPEPGDGFGQGHVGLVGAGDRLGARADRTTISPRGASRRA